MVMSHLLVPRCIGSTMAVLVHLIRYVVHTALFAGREGGVGSDGACVVVASTAARLVWEPHPPLTPSLYRLCGDVGTHYSLINLQDTYDGQILHTYYAV